MRVERADWQNGDEGIDHTDASPNTRHHAGTLARVTQRCCATLGNVRRKTAQAFMKMDYCGRVVAGFAMFQLLVALIAAITGLVCFYYSFPDIPVASGEGNGDNARAATHAKDAIQRHRDTAVYFGVLACPFVFLNSIWGFCSAYKRSRMGLLLHCLFCAGLVITWSIGAFLPFEMSHAFDASCKVVQDRCCDMRSQCTADLDWHSNQLSQPGQCSIEASHSCPAGGFWHIPSAACMKCFPGTFKENEGAGCCSSCPAGSFTTVDNTTACIKCSKNCPSGHFGNKDGLCALCPAGRYKQLAGLGCCVVCPAGEESSVDRKACTPAGGCPTGFYKSREACKSCSAGKYSSIFHGLSFCSFCPPGKYQSFGASTSCNQCPKGKHKKHIFETTAHDNLMQANFRMSHLETRFVLPAVLELIKIRLSSRIRRIPRVSQF